MYIPINKYIVSLKINKLQKQSVKNSMPNISANKILENKNLMIRTPCRSILIDSG